MAELDDPVEAPEAAMGRLEAALDRIERSARPPAAASPDALVLAARLDAVIHHLRNALAEAAA